MDGIYTGMGINETIIAAERLGSGFKPMDDRVRCAVCRNCIVSKGRVNCFFGMWQDRFGNEKTYKWLIRGRKNRISFYQRYEDKNPCGIAECEYFEDLRDD
jgi:hypothetical protein